MPLDENGGDRVVAFLQRRNALKPCEASGNDRFELLAAPDNTPAILMVQDNGGWVNPPAHLPCYVLTCQNRFAVRMHAKLLVDGAEG